MQRPLVLGRARRGREVALLPKVRQTHMQIVGASGRGKSKLLEHMLREDILNRNGLCLIDPHGTLYEDVVRWCATERMFDKRPVRLINVSDPEWVFGFNPLALDNLSNPQRRVDAMVQACAQVWGGEDTTKTPLLLRCLRALFYLLSVNQLTLGEARELTRMGDAEGFRRTLVSRIGDPFFRHEWEEFEDQAERNPRSFVEQFQSTNNRLMEFLGSPVMRAIIGQRDRVIDFRRCMDEREIILINLAPSEQVSADNARVLGTLIVSELFLKCFGRPQGAPPFYLYIDEAYQFLTRDVENILDQARKFGLHLVLAHQRLGQLRKAGESIYNAIMTGAQTKVVFGGLDQEDARLLAENIFIGEHNLQEAKRAFNRPTVVDQVPDWLLSESTTESVTETSGSSSTTTVVDPDGEEISLSQSDSDPGYSRTEATSSGRHQTYRSVFEDRPTSGYSLEELIYRATAKLVNQPARKAVVKMPGERSRQMTVVEVEEGIAGRERVARMVGEAVERTPYLTRTADALAEIEQRRTGFRTIDAAAELCEPEEHRSADW